MNFDPDWCLRPGVTLKELLEYQNISPRVAAVACGLDLNVIEGVLDGTVEINERIAGTLVALGVTPQFWLNLEHFYRDGLARGKTDVSDQ